MNGVAIARLQDKIISIVLILRTTSCISLPAEWKIWKAIDSSKFKQTNLRSDQKAIDESDRFAELSSELADIVAKPTTKSCFRSESKKGRNWEAMDSTKFTYM